MKPNQPNHKPTRYRRTRQIRRWLSWLEMLVRAGILLITIWRLLGGGI